MGGGRLTTALGWVCAGLLAWLAWLSPGSTTMRRLAVAGAVCLGAQAGYETLTSGVLGFRVAGAEEYAAWQLCARHTRYKRLWKCPGLPVWVLYGDGLERGRRAREAAD